jgi:hypothetical protein
MSGLPEKIGSAELHSWSERFFGVSAFLSLIPRYQHLPISGLSSARDARTTDENV